MSDFTPLPKEFRVDQRWNFSKKNNSEGALGLLVEMLSLRLKQSLGAV